MRLAQWSGSDVAMTLMLPIGLVTWPFVLAVGWRAPGVSQEVRGSRCGDGGRVQ